MILIADIGIPGPEDVVRIAARNCGYEIVKQGSEWVLTKFGRRLHGAELDDAAAKILERVAPRSTPSLREQYLGRTPGKGSRTGRQVIERMETEGSLRWNASGGAEVRYIDPVTKAESWHPLNSTDMGHLHDAVRYWNETGRTLGPKHPDVRKWMLDPANYELQPSSINRSNGARLKDRYMPSGDE